MKIQDRFNKISDKLGDRVIDGIERIITSSILATMEKHVIGSSFMPRGYKEPLKDRLCECPNPEDGTILDRKVYCAICKGVRRVVA